jgi:hypothetical protein
VQGPVAEAEFERAIALVARAADLPISQIGTFSERNPLVIETTLVVEADDELMREAVAESERVLDRWVREWRT